MTEEKDIDKSYKFNRLRHLSLIESALAKLCAFMKALLASFKSPILNSKQFYFTEFVLNLKSN